MNKMHSFFEICLLGSNRFSIWQFNETAIVYPLLLSFPFSATIPTHLLIDNLRASVWQWAGNTRWLWQVATLFAGFVLIMWGSELSTNCFCQLPRDATRTEEGEGGRATWVKLANIWANICRQSLHAKQPHANWPSAAIKWAANVYTTVSSCTCRCTCVCVCACECVYTSHTRVKVCACVWFVSRHLGDKVFTRPAAASKVVNSELRIRLVAAGSVPYVHIWYIYIYMYLYIYIYAGYSLPLALFRRIRIMKKLTLIASELRQLSLSSWAGAALEGREGR